MWASLTLSRESCYLGVSRPYIFLKIRRSRDGHWHSAERPAGSTLNSSITFLRFDSLHSSKPQKCSHPHRPLMVSGQCFKGEASFGKLAFYLQFLLSTFSGVRVETGGEKGETSSKEKKKNVSVQRSTGHLIQPKQRLQGKIAPLSHAHPHPKSKCPITQQLLRIWIKQLAIVSGQQES